MSFSQKRHIKLKKLKKNFTSNKAKYVLVENEWNELSEKSWISTKESPKNLINKLSILNGSKYLSAGTS